MNLASGLASCVGCSCVRAKEGAYEYFLYEGVRFPATNLLPQGRRVSELPPKEQKIINDAIMRDVEHRKAKNLDRADILTEYTQACPEP